MRAVRGAAPPCLATFAPPAIKAIIAGRARTCQVHAWKLPDNFRVRIMKLERGRVLTRVERKGEIRLRQGTIAQVPVPPPLAAAAMAARLGCFPAGAAGAGKSKR